MIAVKVKYEPLSAHDLQTRVERKRKLTPTNFLNLYLMDVNGLFHGTVALSPGKESPDTHFQGV